MWPGHESKREEVCMDQYDTRDIALQWLLKVIAVPVTKNHVPISHNALIYE